MNENAFYNLNAGQMMSRDLDSVSEKLSLQAAARLLSKARVSGVPVVGGQGRCVGVLSTSDFMHFVHERQPAAVGCAYSAASDWQMIDDLPGDEAVGRYMTHDPVTVSPATPITQLARLMLDAHIHRVIVVNEEQKPLGVVSSTDILAAVARPERRQIGGVR